MIVALYARVSTSDQDERLQLPRLRDRPGWQALLSDARAHRFDAVLVTKLDRVMRSLQLFLQELEDFRSMRISIISLDYGNLDPASASGHLTISFLAAIAQWEREINSERTKEALAAKRANGVTLGRPKRSDLPIHKIALMRVDGKSWRQIAAALDIPEATIRKRTDDIILEMESITSSMW